MVQHLVDRTAFDDDTVGQNDHLLSDASQAARIAANGWAHAASKFSWNDIGERLSELLQSSIGLTARSDPLPDGEMQVARR